jgi:arylsulfatase A-like enzyme
MTLKPLHILFLFLFVFSCSTNETIGEEAQDDTEESSNSSSPNILLVIADDMGLDATPGYSIGDIKPFMPTLQSLSNNGIRFTNVWSNPVCTPTRASMLTGKYGFKTNVIGVGDVLSTSEESIQRHLDDTNSGYSHAVIGKWHLGNGANHPNNMGINYYAGINSGGVQSYWNWSLNINGQTTNSNEYTTTKFTDLAIDWVGEQTEPWFLWLAYNAPHTPFHLPPNELHYQGSLPTDQASIDANPLPYYLASLEAMDTEMGRLLNSMSQEKRDNTVIIFIGDNGTPNQVAQEYRGTRTKGTVYQGGINVPMIVSGNRVSRINDIEDALINTTDIFATISDLANTGTSEINDSKSLKLLFSSANSSFRDYAYSEVKKETGEIDVTIRNATHKYILFNDGSEALYNLQVNPLENPNLLNASQLPLSATDEAIKNELVNKLEELINQ